MTLKQYLPLIFCMIFLGQTFAQEKEQEQENDPILTTLDSIYKLNEVVLSANVIFGSKFEARNRTGSSYYISPAEIQKFNYTDINRVLKSVPGVNMYEEDGFGLRPNISLRGTSPERSAKITLMEDGVLIAPAPYSAPAAYYFPTIARMHAVEVLKGSSQVQFGPYTTGGAINLISTPIPDNFSGMAEATYGSFNSTRAQARIGDSRKHFGYMIEYLNYTSDGFKDLDNGGNTGFDKNDLVAKFRVNTDPEAAVKQSLTLKFQYGDEDSNETYLGLSQNDFNATPFRRYAGTQIDNMDNEHTQFTATHVLDLSKDFRISTTGYINSFKRNWYKLDKVDAGNGSVGIASIMNDPFTYTEEYAVVSGAANNAGDALMVKANNRAYDSRGVQTKLDYHWRGDQTFHDIEIGLRYHTDEMDRFQWVDDYSITNGIMNLKTAGIPGTDSNRIHNATALAAFAMYKFKYKDLTLTPGLRFESMTLARDDYGKNDVDRTGIDLSSRENKVDVWIPGIGFNYNLDNRVSVFGGIHKGFSPPGSTEGQDAEESINYELGSRFSFGLLSGELIGFFNDYSNLLGSDFAATGGTGNLDQFNAGEVNVIGMEVLLNYEFLKENKAFSLPVTFGYTYTDSEFRNSFSSSDELWGDVAVGDEMPYISKHQFNAMLSLVHKRFDLNLSGRYNGAFRTQAGSGAIPADQEVASNFVIDMAANYHLTKHLSLTGNISNLLNETYAVSRVPAGLRPGLPFAAYGGLRFGF
ncbi:TonB-dependent receptor family protein [Robertkochia sediminum]|uniref:TonB-dependent receptor family protein n=1 Tax=Robertkochia sediminum TaxID=2785326 RepID=UPI001933C9E0|nr:TonB-dependent receptor [Robertkochia sediminum]